MNFNLKSLARLIKYIQKFVSRADTPVQDKVFTITMTCDALLLTGQSLDCMADFLTLPSLVEFAKLEVAPIQTLFLLYGKKYHEIDYNQTKAEKPFIYGYYELNFSTRMQSMFHKINPDLTKFSYS